MKIQRFNESVVNESSVDDALLEMFLESDIYQKTKSEFDEYVQNNTEMLESEFYKFADDKYYRNQKDNWMTWEDIKKKFQYISL